MGLVSQASLRVSNFLLADLFDPETNLTSDPTCVTIGDDEFGLRTEEVCVCNRDLCNYSGAQRGELFDIVPVSQSVQV